MFWRDVGNVKNKSIKEKKNKYLKKENKSIHNFH